MYHILFGKPPQSFYEELVKVYPQTKNVKTFTYPSDYFYHDLFPDSLINDILYTDFEIKDAKNSRARMIDAIHHKTFEAMFKDVFTEPMIINEMFDKNNKEFLNRIGCYMDLISACLDYIPSKRPTIRALVNCPCFQLDTYENIISKQFSQIMIVYKSPSLTIRDRVLLPLRKMCARSLRNPKSIIDMENDLLAIMDVVNWSLIERKPKPVEDMKKDVTTKFKSSQMKYSNMSKSGKETKEMKEDERNRANNQILVKFIFENRVLDHLVFLALRHHTQSRKYLMKKNTKVERNYDDTMRALKGMLEIFKSVIFDMESYEHVSVCGIV